MKGAIASFSLCSGVELLVAPTHATCASEVGRPAERQFRGLRDTTL